MSFQKIGKYKLDGLNKCFYSQHFSKNMICKLTILNFSKKFISEKKLYYAGHLQMILKKKIKK